MSTVTELLNEPNYENLSADERFIKLMIAAREDLAMRMMAEEGEE